jgi:hypothetical protein
MRGRVDRRGDSLQIVCETVNASLPEPTDLDRETEALLLRFAAGGDTWSDIHAMQEVDEILRRHEGTTPVILEVPAGGEEVRRLRSRSRRIEWSQRLREELQAAAGILIARLMPVDEIRLAS